MLKRICRIGISSEKENTLKIADRMFSTTDPPTYPLYGATYRFNIFQKAFI
jgi:hypothetical protein